MTGGVVGPHKFDHSTPGLAACKLPAVSQLQVVFHNLEYEKESFGDLIGPAFDQDLAADDPEVARGGNQQTGLLAIDKDRRVEGGREIRVVPGSAGA